MISTSPIPDHERLFGYRFAFAKKKQRVGPYFQDFSTSSSGLVITTLANWYRQSCTIQLAKHHLHQLPSLGIT
jgi:hypothetical protein